MSYRHLSALIAFCLTLSPVTQAANITWDVHIGLWSVGGNWIGGVPSNTSPYDSVFINNPGRIEHVTIDINANAASLTLSDGGVTQIPDSITLQNGLSLNIHGGGFLNDGHFLMQSTGALTTLNFIGAQTVAGRGEIVMSDNSANRITTNNTILQHGNGFGHEIRGAGRILDNLGGMHNLGTIRQQGSNALVIDPNALGFDNDGLLVAEDAGGLEVVFGTFDNVGGEIRANDSSHVDITGATINGGTFSTIGSGVINVSNSTLDDIANLGLIRQANGTTVTVTGGLLHNGTWELNSSGALTTLNFTGAQTITGNGEIVLGNNSANRIINNNTVTTVGNGITIRGAGRILDNLGGMDNQGSIIADQSLPFVIDPNGQGFAQNGILRAEGSGGLQLLSGVFNLFNPVDVDPGSALFINNATLNNGVLNVGAGVEADIRTTTLNNMTVNGDVRQVNNITNTFNGGLNLNGNWFLDSVGSLTSLQFNGNETITGNGEIVLSNNSANRIINNNTVTTVGNGITIRGAGRILDNLGGMDNQGSIIADQSLPFVIDPNGQDFAQNGILRAEGTGGLQLLSGVFNLFNPVDVDPGSALFIDNATLNNGVLNVGAGVEADIRTTTLNNMTVNGDVRQVNNITNTFNGGLNLNGNWFLDSVGSLTSIQFNGNETITGNGEIVLSNNSANRIINNNTVTTVGNGITIRGAGRILDNLGGMDNQGSIIADQSLPFVIDPNGQDFAQNGILRAEGSGGLQLLSGVFNLFNPVDVDPGSALFINNATLNNGVLNVGAGVEADIRTTTLNNMTVNGDVIQLNAITNTFNGGLELNGTWTVASGGSLTSLLFNGPATISGNGDIVFTDISTNRIINNNSITTIGAGITLSGGGRILDNLGGMNNQGSIVATGVNPFIIDPNPLGFDQNGELRASGSGGLRLIGGTFDLFNPVDVDAGSALQVSSARLNAGALNIGAGVEADIRNSTLDAMTINGNVTQANAISNFFLNGLTLNGTWTMDGAGSLTTLQFTGNQTIGGIGEIVLADNTTNRIINNNSITTVGSNITIRGAGRLLDNQGGMVNQGSIIADGASAMTINPNPQGFENQGSVLAIGPGGIISTDNFIQTAGSTIVESQFTLSGASQIQINGGLLGGSGNITGDVVNNAGQVGPGSSPGTLSIDGDFTQGGAGDFLVEIAGNLAGEFDVLAITGDANLGGDIEVSLLGGYIPSVGNVFNVLIANQLTGMFATGPFIDVGVAVFEIAYDNNTVSLTVVSAVPLPAGVWLMLSALAGLFVTGRRRQTRQRAC